MDDVAAKDGAVAWRSLTFLYFSPFICARGLYWSLHFFFFTDSPVWREMPLGTPRVGEERRGEQRHASCAERRTAYWAVRCPMRTGYEERGDRSTFNRFYSCDPGFLTGRVKCHFYGDIIFQI